MAATYTSSPSLAMIPLAGAARQDGDRQWRSGAAAAECGGRTRGGVKQIGGSWELDPGEAERARVYRRGTDPIGRETGRRWAGKSMAVELSTLLLPIRSAPRARRWLRAGILGVRAPKKLGFFFFFGEIAGLGLLTGCDCLIGLSMATDKPCSRRSRGLS